MQARPVGAVLDDDVVQQCGGAVEPIGVVQLGQLEGQLRPLVGRRQVVAAERVDMGGRQQLHLGNVWLNPTTVKSAPYEFGVRSGRGPVFEPLQESVHRGHRLPARPVGADRRLADGPKPMRCTRGSVATWVPLASRPPSSLRSRSGTQVGQVGLEPGGPQDEVRRA